MTGGTADRTASEADGSSPTAPVGIVDAADLRALFEAVPGRCAAVAVDAPRYTVLAATDAFCRGAGVARETLLGRGIFEVFPDAPADADGASRRRIETALRASLDEVLRTRATHRMEVQRYDLPMHGVPERPRFWRPCNTPVLAADGTVRFVIHQAEDVTEHVLQRAAIDAAERRARRILEQVSDAHVTLDRDFRVLTANAAAERMIGMPREAFLGRSHWEVFPGSRGTEPERHYRRARAERVEAHFTHHYVDATHDLHVEIDAYPTDDDGLAIFWRDVSARVRAEETAHDAAARDAFRVALADALRPLVDAADIQRVAACTLGAHLGASRVHYGDVAPDDAHVDVAHDYTDGVASLTGRFVMTDFGPTLVDALRAGRTLVVPDVARSAELTDAERAAYAAVGVGAQVGVPLLVAGRLAALLAVHQAAPRAWTPAEVALIEEVAERTWYAVERARAESVLRASEARFRLMADAVPQIVWITDAEGRTEFFNRQWADYTGAAYVPATAAAVAQEFVHPDDRALTMEVFAEARRVGGMFAVEHRIRSASGDYRWFLVRAEPYREPETGEIVRWFGASVDIHDRKLAEAALRESETRYRSLFESIDDGFCVLEMLFDDAQRPVDYRFLEANPAFSKQTGLVDAVGRTARELVPNLEAHWFETYGRVATTGEATRFQLGSDAMGRWFDVYAFRVGRPEARRIALLFADVSAAREAEAERARLWAGLAAERERLQSLIRSMPAPVALHTGPEHRFALVSDSFRQVSGGRDLTGMTPQEAYPELVGHGVLERFEEVLATGEPWISRETYVRFDRRGRGLEETWFDLRYEPVRDAEGRVVGVLNLAFDVTEQVRARREVERLLAESERARTEAEKARAATERARERTARLQALTAALARARSVDDVANAVVADMVVALDARTGALAVRAPDDEAALVLLRTEGFPDPLPAGVRRQSLDSRSPLPECFLTGRPIWIERRDGPEGLDDRYPLIAPVWDRLGVGSAAFVPLIAAGDVVGVISFSFVGARTFSPADREFLLSLGQQAALAVERARLFESEREARREAEGANRAKAEFLATMSHELRTPLNAIGGYAELLELGIHGPVTDAQRVALERIQRSQRHLLGLIAGVLDYSRLEAGAVTYHLADVPVAEAVSEAEVLVAPQLRAKGLGYAWSGAPPGLCVRADREKLQQILLNLLSNAVKFTHARDGTAGRIEVACAAEGTGPGARVRIHVRDTGAGISADKLTHVFEPFVQVDQRLTRPSEGVGLGLAISRDLAHGMGGDLTVESAPGVGSTFTLVLPAA
jgi:PAS domain S-box-containing protein